MKVIAVVVTYNRLELLGRCLEGLRRNRPLSGIIVVDNGSTDGTREWLDAQEGLTVVHQSNTGGAGGFHRGIREAYSRKADWIWCMDDDVFPRADCLERMLPHTGDATVGILAPRRLMEGEVFSNDFRAYNLTQPFRSMYRKPLPKDVSSPVEIAGTAFEGLFVRKEVVASIGLPNKDLFIFCDDTDYCLRAVLAGYRIVYVPDALMDKHRFFRASTWRERNRQKKWKRFYQLRNSTYLNHHYGKNGAVRYLRGWLGMAGYVATVAATCAFTDVYQWSDIARFWRMYRDGIRERLGIIH